jgi:hypothetical protein
MSQIKIKLHTSQEGDIDIDMKAECNLNELEVATGYMMAALVNQSTTGLEVLTQLLEDIKNGDRTADTIKDS